MLGSMTEEKIELIRHEDSFWYQFMQKTVELDSRDAPHSGWYWFLGLYYLYYTLPEIPRFMLVLLQEHVTDNHWLKKIHEPDVPEEADFYAIKNAFATKNCEELFEFIADLTNKHGIPELIDFSRLHFDSHANFSGFIFPLEVRFDYTEFSTDVLFDETLFYNKADFIKTQFSGEAVFRQASFFAMVNFQNATFRKNALFNKVSFPLIAAFQEVTFVELADFTDSVFSRTAIFRKSKFCSLVAFKNTIFEGNTNFMEVKFETYAPYFYDAEINADITWDKNIKLWPQTRKHETDKTPEKYQARIDNNKNSYENLAYHMKKKEKYHDQHFFFRQETRWRQKLEKKILIRCAFWLYEKLSDYGYGIERAVASWFWHIVIGSLIIFAIRAFDRFNMSLEDLGCSVGISLSNSHAFFFKGDRLEKCYETFEYLPWFNFIWGSQTIVGTLLIFLVLLTLRIRFRLK